MRRKICKSVTACLLAGILGISAASVQAAEVDNGVTYPITTNSIDGWPQGPDTYSETAVLMDADTGVILYNKGMDEKRYPASITKIMTALLALENSNLDDQVTFTEECLADQTSDSGNIGMQVGEVLTMRQCLLALMIRSANDVATQIAVHIAGSVSAFSDMMNQRAQELGCVNTHFVNASGMPDENHYTTAHDMALIFQEAIKNQDFKDIIGTQSFTIDPTNMNPESRTYSTHHALVAQSAPEHYEGCFGGKTGVTEASKNTLVSGATRNGMTLIAVAMRAEVGQVCQDHISMFDYGFNNFQKVEVPGGAVTIPKDAQVTNLTNNENNYYYRTDYYVGSGSDEAETQQDEPETITADEPESTPEVTETPADNGLQGGSESDMTLYRYVIYILFGLIGVTLVITIVSAARKSMKKKKRRKS
ncbi:D-alanyl-D-alanine carboxypeptidase [Blautia sp. TF11-31AT]|jgi:serine-type D-Ala-D-Ala carboxypeptidase (penicillin-binding protein 5/6)|nr:D-alanyl-D-alanine carboxypeptidase [Blautia sp. TF11-31AT]